PNFIICRSDKPIPADHRAKIALFCNVNEDHVIESSHCESLYEAPLMLEQSRLADLVCQDLDIPSSEPDLTEWIAIVGRHLNPKRRLKVALVGKYVQLHDAFLSVVEALTHGGIYHETQVDIEWVSADDLNAGNVEDLLRGVSGIIVPGGFGERGVSGKIDAVRYAREQKIPFFGVCLGMQTAAIELLRNVGGLTKADSTEFNPNTDQPVVSRMSDQISGLLGGTMRLGSYNCRLAEDSLIRKAYGEEIIRERHRHRYEINHNYIADIERCGARITGVNPESGLIEAIELKDHPWFVGVQFHPEFTSRPNRPNPLFRDFVGAALYYGSERNLVEELASL
ncbi:MAG: CTP synthase, partial [Clostridiaceae bacterium]|nr:CTP synthase [Clostridiaceae bacterium]